MFGVRKKRGLKRVRDLKVRDAYVPADGEHRVAGTYVLILLLFALIAVLIEHVLPDIFGRYRGGGLPPVRLTGHLLLVCLGAFVVGGYLLVIERRTRQSERKLLNFGILCMSFFAAARLLLLLEAVPKFLTPVSVLAILLVILYSQRLAFVGVLVVAFLVSLSLQPASAGAATAPLFDFQFFVVNAAGAMAGILSARRVETRTRLIKVGGLVGIGHAAGLLFGYMLMQAPAASGWHLGGWGIQVIWRDLFWCLVSGVSAGFILSGALPFVERFFRLTTDIRLMELSDLNQPILRKFLLEAPGSYHHSLMVGTLCEAAAQRVGANPLLARVGSYFHDIGKLNKPEYFTENEAIKGSKHAALSPTMSTLVIIAHVKDGVEIAEEMNLPGEVVAIIREHHGTSLVEYFYREAVLSSRREGQKAGGANLGQGSGERPVSAGEGARGEAAAPEKVPAAAARVGQELFRYPGPKPSSREAAIVLMGDAVEAITRTLEEPSPSRIGEVVEEAVRRRLSDGQLDESRLTLTDIRRIEETFTRVLTGIFHTRIKYQTAALSAAERGTEGSTSSAREA